MTSNITSNVKTIGFKQDKARDIKNKLEDVLNIEFINRINHIVVFNDLKEEVIRDIIKNETLKIKKKFILTIQLLS